MIVNRMSFFIPLGTFLVILGIGYVGFSLDDRKQLPSALLDKPFPEFSANSLLDPELRIRRQDLLGKPTLVNVWATWCPTCLSEHDQLMDIAEMTEIRMVGINYKDDVEKAQRWLAQYGNPFDLVIRDERGLLGVELGVYGAPETFLLDAQGNIVYKRVGDVNPRIWRDELLPRFRLLEVEMVSRDEAS